jgi:hypothetical protein
MNHPNADYDAQRCVEQMKGSYTRLSKAGGGLVRKLVDWQLDDLVTFATQIEVMAKGEQHRREQS